MKNGIKERKDGKKERGKENKDLEQIRIYQAKRIRQNIEGRPNTRIKHKDQTYRRNIPDGKNDKNIVFGKKIDLDPPIG